MAKPPTTTQMHSTESSSGYVLFKTFNASNPSFFYHLSWKNSLLPVLLSWIWYLLKRKDDICVFLLNTDERGSRALMGLFNFMYFNQSSWLCRFYIFSFRKLVYSQYLEVKVHNLSVAVSSSEKLWKQEGHIVHA